MPVGEARADVEIATTTRWPVDLQKSFYFELCCRNCNAQLLAGARILRCPRLSYLHLSPSLTVSSLVSLPAFLRLVPFDLGTESQLPLQSSLLGYSTSRLWRAFSFSKSFFLNHSPRLNPLTKGCAIELTSMVLRLNDPSVLSINGFICVGFD